MSYKKIIYDNYVKNHNSFLYGNNSIKNIEKHFPSWKYYFLHLLPNNKNSKILDIGCGDGNFVYFLNQLGYPNAIGVDISKEQIEAGRKMGIQNLIHQDMLQYLNSKILEYDLIIARDVVEHFTKDEVFEICRSVHRALNHNGKFLIQVPNGEGLFYTSIYYGDYTHETAYTWKSLNQIFKNLGFSEIKCFEVAPPPSDIKSIIRFLLWKFVKVFIRIIKTIVTGSGYGIFTPNLICISTKSE